MKKKIRFEKETPRMVIRGSLMLLLGMLFAFTAIASNSNFRNYSTLELSLWNNSAFEVVVGNQVYRSNGVLRLDQIRPGNHSIRIQQRMSNRYGQGGGGIRTVFSGQVHIPAGRLIRAEISRFRRWEVVASRSLSRPQVQQPVNGCSNLNPASYNSPNHSCSCQFQCACQNISCGNDQDLYGNEAWCNASIDNGYGYSSAQQGAWLGNGTNYIPPAAMNQSEFNHLIAELEDNFFDDQRFILAKQAIGESRVSTDQVVRILEAFNFESTRLDFAKYAYSRVLDPMNYWRVNNQFSFSSSIRELDQYISSN